MNSVFDKHYKKYDAWYDKNKFVYLSEVDAIRKAMPKYGEGLEIGVGTGRFAAKLNIGTGIDPSKEMLKLAETRGVNTHRASGEDLPFSDDTFDYVAIIVTLCFVSDPLKVLKEARRVLKPGSRIIIGIVDKESFLGTAYQKKEKVFYKNARFFSVKDLTELLKTANFNNFSHYQTIFKNPKEIKSVESAKKGFGEGGFVVIAAEKQ
ncbi:MAG: class I SAM-dependent methyltransferase [Candidatus Omnitrophica bacterium]|nr:class I SAM-dependent methyltransferase [Candidatus Omnitrophota bacterium]